MLRRLCALLLMLACALAPAFPAHEAATPTQKKDCDCDRACCANRECAPTAPTPARSAVATLVGVEQRANAAKPAKRVPLLAFVRTILFSPAAPIATPARVATPARIVPADSAALFEAHCSFLI